MEAGRSIAARNTTLLGFFGEPPNGRHDNVNLNGNLFALSAFVHASFDETIVCGYEDMAVCPQLLAQGYVIRFDADLVNTHAPPQHGATASQERYRMAGRARVHTSVKRYLLWQRNWRKLLAFVAVAPAHRALHAIKNGKWFDLPHAVRDMGYALRATLRARARPHRP